jgi:putative membrane protein
VAMAPDDLAGAAPIADATLADRRVHPGTIVLRFVKELPSTVLALPAAVAFMSDRGLRWAIAAAAVMAVVMILLNWLAWSRFRYGVGANDIVIESGILNRTRRSIPFDRIQDVDIERKPLARIFGLAKIRIETGGAGKDEGVLDSVSVAEADRVRAAVRAHRGGPGRADGAGPALDSAADSLPAARLLFALDLPRLLLLGLFNFSMVYIAGLFALLQTFDRFIPFDIYNLARWAGVIDKSLPGRFTAAAIMSVAALALLLGVAAGLVRTVARDYGFRLTSEGRRMRRVRGLFTHTEIVLARKRIQLAIVQTGPIRHLFGWSGLSFQSLGAGSDGSGRQSAAPLARAGELEPILAEVGGLRLPPPPDLVMVSRRHIARSLIRQVPLAVAILAASLWKPISLLLLLLLPPLALGAVLRRRFHRYALAGDLLFIQRGFWRRKLWIVPVRNAQAISLSRSRPQSWLGLATLAVDTAGAPTGSGVRIVDLREDLGRALAAEISSQRSALRLHASGRKSGTDR